jgi:hypothetical protein
MKIRADLAELLHAGWSDKAIASHLHTHRRKVRDARHTLGIPVHKPGPTPAGSPEDIFWRRAQPTDDGHLLWPAMSNRYGAHINHQGRRYSVHRIAWGIANNREPVGKVRTGCGQYGCVHPAHVEDRLMRDQYNAIFGAAV